MAAPRDAARDSRAGLRGAPSPPPLSAAGSLNSSPSLPRSCPGPFHPPIKLFFFFFQTSWEDPGGPMGGLEVRANSGGGGERTNRSMGWAGGGACATGRADGAAGREGRAPADNLQEGRASLQVTLQATSQGRGSPVSRLGRRAQAPPRPNGWMHPALAPGLQGERSTAPSTKDSASPTRYLRS